MRTSRSLNHSSKDSQNWLTLCSTICISRVRFPRPHFTHLTDLNPVKASGHRTPQPTPADLSAMKSTRSPDAVIGTSLRVSTLRAECLVRDHYRCVISRIFDLNEAVSRDREFGPENSRDDEGELLLGQITEHLEVAHIMPHALMQEKDSKPASLYTQTSPFGRTDYQNLIYSLGLLG